MKQHGSIYWTGFIRIGTLGSRLTSPTSSYRSSRLIGVFVVVLCRLLACYGYVMSCYVCYVCGLHALDN